MKRKTIPNDFKNSDSPTNNYSHLSRATQIFSKELLLLPEHLPNLSNRSNKMGKHSGVAEATYLFQQWVQLKRASGLSRITIVEASKNARQWLLIAFEKVFWKFIRFYKLRFEALLIFRTVFKHSADNVSQDNQLKRT